MKVLIADDSRSLRTMLGRWLVELGYVPILASNGEEALEQAWREGIQIGIVDWEMPLLDGLEVCWRLRADERTRHIHLILITARTNSDALIQALDAGADDFIYKPFDKASMWARLRAATRILTMRRDLLRLAQLDPLTGAFNRRAFTDRANQERQAAVAQNLPISLLAADIDHFKKVNDTYGHASGDEALRRFVSVCQGTMMHNEVLGRIGGEEFAVLLPGSDFAQAEAAGERIRSALEAVDIRNEQHLFRITVSVGVAQFRSGHETLEETLTRADEALYRAKREGRNRVCLAR